MTKGELSGNHRSNRKAAIAFALLIGASLAAFAAYAFTGGSTGALSILRWLEAQTIAEPVTALTIYALICFASQLVVIPSGTVIALGGGYLFGTIPGGGILAAGAMLASLIVYAVARGALAHLVSGFAANTPARQRALETLRHEGAAGVLALRLSPVVPSAVTATLSAAAGIRFSTFALMSAAAIWVRPLAFAGAGSSLHTLADAGSGAPMAVVLGVTGLSMAALVVLGARLLARWELSHPDK